MTNQSINQSIDQSINQSNLSVIQVGPKKPDHFLKYVTPVHDEVGRQYVYQNVELFIGSKPNVRNVAIINGPVLWPTLYMYFADLLCLLISFRAHH